MGKMSRSKGARGERELAARLNKIFNVKARRGRQFSGSPDSPDVVAFTGVHIECKRTERLNLYDAMDQAKEDSGDNIPIVAHRKNGRQWVIVANLDDLSELCTLLEEYKKA